MKRATPNPCENCVIVLYFNPRPREEGDVTGVATDTVIDNISIHALVKRATVMLTELDYKIYISIHALVKRATQYPVNIYGVYFISIHALVKRATRQKCGRKHKIRYFNPRPREEGDSLFYQACFFQHLFQSTPS